MPEELYSVEQVAQRLGLHVRTVRHYVRSGRLKAVRIGKQYRIARANLEALTGRPVLASDGAAAARFPHVEVSSIVQIDPIGEEAAGRMANTLMAAVAGPRDDHDLLRVESIYDRERARLKVIAVGSVTVSAELLRLIPVLLGSNA